MVRADALHSGRAWRIAKLVLLLILCIGFTIFGIRWITGSSENSNPPKEQSVSPQLEAQINGIGFTVSQPAAIFEDFRRTEVAVIPPTATKTKCVEVLQRYQRTNNSKVDYVDIYSYSPECAYPRPDDADSYSIGDYSGWVSDSDPKLSVLYELTVNQAMARIETDVAKSKMAPVLKNFETFSSSAPPDTVKWEND